MRPSRLPRTLAAALAALLLAACSDAVTLPQGTRLVASLDGAVHPDSVSVGDTVRARLAGNLEGGEGVLMVEGTPLVGTVTAVQRAQGQWPLVLKLDFAAAEVGGAVRPLPMRIAGVEAEVDEAAEGSDAMGMGLMGSVVEGRAGAAMVRPDVAREAGTAVALGSGERTGHLPGGGRLELEVTARTELPLPGGGS